MPSAVAVGIDVGGTKLLGVAVDVDQPDVVVAEHRVDTPRGGPALVDATVALVASLETGLGGEGTVAAVGVGSAGQIGIDGTVHFSPNLPGVVDLALGRELDAALVCPVVVENDANCALVAEARTGAAAGVSDVVLVTLGTGIGGGVLIGGVLLRGRNGFAGEPGHTVVDPHGPLCPCGRRGCWERFASGSGLGRLARDAAAAGRADAVVALAGDAESVRGEHVHRAALAGDAEARAILDELGWWVAAGIANLIDVLDPEMVVVGGGLVDLGELLFDPLRRSLPDQVLAAAHRVLPPVVPAALGEGAGARGAAALAADLVAPSG